MESAAVNTNSGSGIPAGANAKDVRWRKFKHYCERWDVELFHKPEEFKTAAHTLTIAHSPVGGAKIDLFVGAMYVPKTAGVIVALHELGHLMLSGTLGPPRRHNEDHELACFEYYSILWLGWSVPHWKAWRSRTGSARDGDLGERNAKKPTIQAKLIKTGLFESGSESGLYPTFKSFMPHPHLDRRVGQLMQWM